MAATFYTTTPITTPDGSVYPWRPMVDADAAQCIADRLVDAFGLDRVQELRLSYGPWHSLGHGIGGLFTRAEATTTVEVFRACSPDWELLLLGTITQGAEELRDETLRCVADGLDDDVTFSVFVDALVRADLHGDPPATTDGQLDNVVMHFEMCFAPDEVRLLDWN